jgi:hypothetical protein
MNRRRLLLNGWRKERCSGDGPLRLHLWHGPTPEVSSAILGSSGAARQSRNREYTTRPKQLQTRMTSRSKRSQCEAPYQTWHSSALNVTPPFLCSWGATARDGPGVNLLIDDGRSCPWLAGYRESSGRPQIFTAAASRCNIEIPGWPQAITLCGDVAAGGHKWVPAASPFWIRL